MLTGLEQKLGSQEYKKKKMGFGSKTLITGGTIAGATYLTGKKMWNYFYPPSLKRYFAAATMFLCFYGVTHPGTVRKSISGFFTGTRNVMVRRIDRTQKLEQYEKLVKEVISANKELKYQYKEKDKALEKAREYISELEEEAFNARSTLRENNMGLRKPPKEAFLNYLLHDKDYNAIVYKIDCAIGRKGGD